jgi:hypothetical protein
MGSRRRARRWDALLLLGLAVGLYCGAVNQAVHGLIGRERWNWADMALYGGACAVLYPALWSLSYRAARSAVDRGWIPESPARRVRDQQSRLAQPAIATGALPPGADPAVWRRALRSELQELNAQRWMASAALAVVAGVIGAAAVVANDNAWTVWALAILVLAGGLSASHLWGRRRRVERLLAELP